MNIKPEEPLFKWKWMSLSGRPASKSELAKFNDNTREKLKMVKKLVVRAGILLELRW